MNKFKTFFCLLLGLMMTGTATVAAATPETVSLRFNRTGTDASSVTITVVGSDGNAIPGAAATMTSGHAFKATASAVADSTLCPDVNGSSSPTIVLTFNITGLPDGFAVKAMGLDIHAFNASGAYQSNADNKSRQWNVAVSRGASADALTDFASLTDIDIAAGVGTSGNVHQLWTVAADEAVETGATQVVQLTVTKGTTNSGCFFGLSSLTLSSTDDVVLPAIKDGAETPEEPGLADGGIYYFRWYGGLANYITEEADGSLVVASQDVAQRQFWQLESTGRDNCYYIRNTATGRYIQSCNLTASSASKVKAGTDPVEYYLAQVTTDGSAVKGYYRLTSTDCTNYDNTAQTPVGLNKDGASTGIIAWHAGESNTGSFWKIEATEDLYELRPFTPSAEVGKPLAEYVLTDADGRALTMAADGALAMQSGADTDNSHWYFVGTSNNTEGWLLVNTATGLSLDRSGETATRWRIFQDDPLVADYYFRPFAAQDDAEATLSVDGSSRFTLRGARSAFSRSAQIYNQPCGALGTIYVKQATIDGDAALVPMTYPLATLSGTAIVGTTASAPSSWYTLFTTSKATLVSGRDAAFSLTLSEAPADGVTLTAYYDWNHDGIFETAQPLTANGTAVATTIAVPADATPGKVRLRLRITANGLTDAEDEVTGQIVDFVFNVTDQAPAEAQISVGSNDPARGTARVESAEAGHATVVATPSGNASFLCWREGSRIVSLSATYSFDYDRSMALTACFSPNTTVSVGIDDLVERSALVNVSGEGRTITVDTDARVRLVLVYTPDGALVARATGKVVRSNAIDRGTYIVKVFTDADDVACKVSVK